MPAQFNKRWYGLLGPLCMRARRCAIANTSGDALRYGGYAEKIVGRIKLAVLNTVGPAGALAIACDIVVFDRDTEGGRALTNPAEMRIPQREVAVEDAHRLEHAVTEQEALVVMLTNRAHLVAKRSRFELRARIHDLIMEAFLAG